MAPEPFGQPYYLHATRTNLGPIRQDVNAVWDLAPHDIAIFNYLLDEQPLLGVGDRHARAADRTATTSRSRRSATPNDVVGNIHVSWADPNKVREVVAVGSRRRVVFNDLNDVERVRVFERGVSVGDAVADSYGEFKLLVRDGDIISPKIEPSEPLKNQCAGFRRRHRHRPAAARAAAASASASSARWSRSRRRCAREERPLKCDVPGAVEVQLGADAVIDPGVLLGYPSGRPGVAGDTRIGAGARIRAGSIVYAAVDIGDDFETGHHADRPRREPHRQPLHALEQLDDRLRLRHRRPRADSLQRLHRAVHHDRRRRVPGAGRDDRQRSRTRSAPSACRARRSGAARASAST